MFLQGYKTVVMKMIPVKEPHMFSQINLNTINIAQSQALRTFWQPHLLCRGGNGAQSY